MDSLLKNVTKEDVQSSPWPHILIKDVLKDEIALKLINAIPDINDFSKTKFTDRAFDKDGNPRSNKRIQHMMPDVLEDGGIWARFVDANTSPEHAKKCIDLFEDDIYKHYPKFKPKEKIKHCRYRVRPDADIGWTVCIGANTPSFDGSSVLGYRHVDAPTKMFFGLYYLRHPDDDSEGGELQIYDGKEVVQTVKYERNVFVLGLNTPKSIHAVTPRGDSKYPRYFGNFYAEVKSPLYNTPEELRYKG